MRMMLLPFLRDHNVLITKHLTLTTLLASLTMAISVFSYGFETGVLDTIQAMPYFDKQFGQFDPATKKHVISPSHLAYLNSFPLILYAVGVIVASQIGEHFGRRAVLIFMNCICLSGVAICYTATTFGQFLAGRMIVQMHVGMEAWLVPMFQGEIVPAAIRGSMVITYTFNHIFATFISSIITDRTSKFPNDSSWKIPVLCMFAFPSLTLLMSFLVPESPRWLLRKNKRDQAAKALYYLESARPGYVVDDQINLLQEALEVSVFTGKWKDIFKGNNLRRTLIPCLGALGTQLTGQSFASTYGTIFIRSVNIMDPFRATLIKRGLLLFGCLVPIFIVDKIGPRKLLFSAGALSAATLFTMGALASVHPQSVSLKKGIIATAIVFPTFYIGSFAPVGQLLVAEVPHITLRDKASLLTWSLNNICNFVASYTLPYLLFAPYAALGPRVAFIYGSTSVFFLTLMYFLVPDLTGRSLEEVDEIYDNKIPARHTRKYVSTGHMATLTAMENARTPTEVVDKMDGVEHVEEHAVQK